MCSSDLPPPKFHFEYTEKPYEKVLQVQNLRLNAGEKVLLKDCSFTLMRGEKCAVVGDNGTGKSTLLKTLLSSKSEAICFGRFVKTAYYDQENANLNGENTVLAELWERHVLWDQTRVRSTLARIGLPAEDMDKKVRMLSGGERAKLALAVFESEKGNFLLLDEPTNHLDLSARESLESALKAFDGTILFVSHDRYFIRAIAGKILELEQGKATFFIGDYDEFQAQKSKAKTDVGHVPTPIVSQKTEHKESYYRTKEERSADARRQTKIKNIEKEITALESEEAQINEDISTPEIASNFPLLNEKCIRLEAIKNRLDELYTEYETLIS